MRGSKIGGVLLAAGAAATMFAVAIPGSLIFLNVTGQATFWISMALRFLGFVGVWWALDSRTATPARAAWILVALGFAVGRIGALLSFGFIPDALRQPISVDFAMNEILSGGVVQIVSVALLAIGCLRPQPSSAPRIVASIGAGLLTLTFAVPPSVLTFLIDPTFWLSGISPAVTLSILASTLSVAGSLVWVAAPPLRKNSGSPSLDPTIADGHTSDANANS
ncbi:MAG: hypothetical protein ACYDDF_11705 [Thermoplasmatota archaeon]